MLEEYSLNLSKKRIFEATKQSKKLKRNIGRFDYTKTLEIC